MKVRWKPALMLLAAGAAFGIGGTQAGAQEISCRGMLGGAGVSGTAEGYRIAATLAQPAIGFTAGHPVGTAQGFWHPAPRAASGRTEQQGSGSPDLSAAPGLFTESTRISLRIPHTQHVTLILYDLLGRPVRTLLDTEQPEGTFHLTLTAEGLSSGRYVVVLTTQEAQQSVPLVLAK